MKTIFTFLLATLLVGCAAAASMQNATLAAAQAGNRDIVSETSTPVMEAGVKNTTSASKPMKVTVKPPRIPIGPGKGTPGLSMTTSIAPAGWLTYTRATLEVVVPYPADWLVTEQVDGATFTSPQGDMIQLTEVQNESAGAQSEKKDLQCATIINSSGLAAETCVATEPLIYSAKFTLTSNDGSPRQVIVSTIGAGALDIYKTMINLLHSAQ